MNISEIQKQRRLSLPEAYLNFLSKIDAGEDYCFNEYPDEYPDFKGRCWAFYDEVLLSESIQMAGAGTAPAHRQLALYLRCYQDQTNKNDVLSPEGLLPLSQVENAFVIAEDDGDFLYLDPEDNFSVWIFYHDSCNVKKTANSITEWLTNAQAA